jgi:hypothetical protein
MPAWLRIVLLATLAAALYGVIHDQITVRISLEYFTVGHPPLFGTEDPTLLGLLWGVYATWWMGALLGLLLAFAARQGPWPRRAPATLVRPVAVLLLVMAGSASLAGLLGFLVAKAGGIRLLEPLASRVPDGRHVAYLTALWAHLASYVAALLGGVWLAWRVRRARKRPASGP